MKPLQSVLQVARYDGNDLIFIEQTGLYVRDVALNLGVNEEICIGFLSDVHLNYCNGADFSEANPVTMSTYQNRQFCAGAACLPKLHNCMAALEGADAVVLNGDTMDYFSHGTVELMQREVFEKYPDVIATIGGHERARQMQGTVPEGQDDWKICMQKLQAFWPHDIYYTKKCIQNKVLLIGMCNDFARFTVHQHQKLQADLNLARQNGWQVLLFVHEPIATGNPAHEKTELPDSLLPGDRSIYPINLCNAPDLAGGEGSDAATMAVCHTITHSADVIKGVFAGHLHNDMHLELLARTPEGADTSIPQFVHNATAYHNGHLMRIFVK